MAKLLRVFALVLLCVLGVWLWQTSRSTPTPTQALATKSATPEPAKIYVSPVYDVKAFDSSIPALAKNQDAWLTHLGATATSEPALDWQGGQATLYRYHNKSEPMLYVIDSDKFFEMVWYYPTALDTDKDKAIAQQYAKRTYAIAKSVLGGQALDFYDNLLKDKKSKESNTPPKGVALAECGNYLCKVVFEKNKVFEGK